MKNEWKQKILYCLPLLALAVLIPVFAGAKEAHADPIEFWGPANCLYEVTDQACAYADDGYDGGVVLKDGSQAVTMGEENALGGLYLPSEVDYEGKTYQVTMIGDNAFQGNKTFNYVRICNTTKYIGNYAFADTNLGRYENEDISFLTGTIIPDSIQHIGNCAFNNCPYLKRIHCASDLPEDQIGYNVMGFAADPTSVSGHMVEDFKVFALKGSGMWNYAHNRNIPCGYVVTDIWMDSGTFDTETGPQIGTKVEAPALKVLSEGIEPEEADYAWNHGDIIWDPDYTGWMDVDFLPYAAGKTFPQGESYLSAGLKVKDPRTSDFSLATAWIRLNGEVLTQSTDLEWNVGNVYAYKMYNLTGIHINKTTITLKDMTYTGSVIKPVITVKYLGQTLKLGTDYTLSYGKPVNVGTFTVTVTGKGKFYGSVKKTFKINAKKILPKVKLSATKYVYNGKVKKPSLIVYDGTKKLAASNYTVTYSKASPKAVGTYKVTVKMKGNYSGSKAVSYTIVPQATYFTRLTRGTGSGTLTWKRVTAQTTGYHVQYSTDKTFKKNYKGYLLKNPKTITQKFGGMKRRTRYYVRIRTYKLIGSKYYCSAWSPVKYITTG